MKREICFKGKRLMAIEVFFITISLIALIAFNFSCKKGSSNSTDESNQGKWISYTTSDGLVCDSVNAITIDKYGNKWFGTDKGISKFDGKTWTTFDNSPSNVRRVRSITTDKQGNVWFAAGGGILEFDGSKWIKYTSNDFGLSFVSTSIAVDPDGNIWCGGTGYTPNPVAQFSVLIKYDGTKWTSFFNYNDPADVITSIAIDSFGNIWYSSGLGHIFKFDGKNHTDITILGSYVYNIAIDIQGNIWFATRDSGVVKFNGSGWIYYNTMNSGLSSDTVRSIAFDIYGKVWFGTKLGLSEFDGTNWINVAVGYIQFIIIDQNGYKWFGTLVGVLVYTGTNLTTQQGSQTGSQVWVLTFNDGYKTQTAKVIVTPFTYSGTFSETSDSPGLWIFDWAPPYEACYRLPVGGNIVHDSPGDRWSFVGMSGSGCMLQTMGSNSSGTANGNFPNANYIGNGVVTLTTQSPGQTLSGVVNWTGQRK